MALSNLHDNLPASVLQALRGRFKDANQILIGGSYLKGYANTESDIDVIVINQTVQAIERENYYCDDILIDLAIHDVRSLRNTILKERVNAMCSMADNIFHAVPLLNLDEGTVYLKQFAADAIRAGPPPFDIESSKAHLLGQVDDIRHCMDQTERMTLAAGILTQLIVFFLRSSGGWLGAAKYMGRDLRRVNVQFSEALLGVAQQAFTPHGAIALADFTLETIASVTGNVEKLWTKSYPIPPS